MGRAKALDRTILSLLKLKPNGLGFNEIFSVLKKETSYDRTVKSKSTLSNALKRLQKEGYIHRDIETRKYQILSEGEKYLHRFEVVDYILSSNKLDSYFGDWSFRETSEPISSVYMLLEAREDASPKAIGVLHKRIQRTNPLNWKNDIFDYALVEGLINRTDFEILKSTSNSEVSLEAIEKCQRKLKKVWESLFKGIERMTVVETVNPKLLFEKCMLSLEEKKGSLKKIYKS